MVSEFMKLPVVFSHYFAHRELPEMLFEVTLIYEISVLKIVIWGFKSSVYGGKFCFMAMNQYSENSDQTGGCPG